MYQQVLICIAETDFKLQIPLEDWGAGSYGFSDYREINLPTGKKFKLLIEIIPPVSVAVTIRDGTNEINVLSYLGVAVNYESAKVGYITISIGASH